MCKCGKTENLIWFDAKECGVVCKDCEHGKVKVSPSTLYTLQYIMYSSIQKLYTFKVSDDVLWELKKIIREYMRYHIDHEFKSLVFCNLFDTKQKIKNFRTCFIKTSPEVFFVTEICIYLLF